MPRNPRWFSLNAQAVSCVYKHGRATRPRYDAVEAGMTEDVAETQSLSQREHFEAIMHRYQGPLLRYVRCSLGEHDAQDVVQEVFLRLHKMMCKSGLRGVDRLGSWLFKVAHNCAADALRRRQRHNKAMEAAACDAANGGCVTPDALEEVVHREDCRLALSLLDKLPPRQRQVLVLKIDRGMSYREIGEVTSQALGTVGYLMNQGLGQLARELKAAGAV